MTPTASLEVRRVVHASVERVFAAWTDPSLIQAWWGPGGVTCPGAEVDLRIGGAYRIGNQMPDGNVAWIVGRFERVEPPRLLVYSWRFEPGPEAESRVTVRFEPHPDGTQVIVLHEKIPGEAMRAEHLAGWSGCLDGLASYLAG